MQAVLAAYLCSRRKHWGIEAYNSLRIKVRESWYAVPDVCIYPVDAFEEDYPTIPPLLWIEILSPDDRMVDVWAKAAELVQNGVPMVWIIDPVTLESQVRTSEGMRSVSGETLSIPDSPIVISLREALEE